MPIQQMLLGTGKPPVKYYIDDVFSMAPYKGTAANNTINNGINLSEDGGLVWLKNRSGVYYNIWHDTEQGVNKSITPQSAMAQSNDGSSRLNQFKTNGFRVGSDTTVNASGNDIMSWCFKKSQGFFDIVKWSGNSTARTINHNLKCIPGFIAVKSMTEGGNWNVYHRGVNKGINPLSYYLLLNGSGTAYSNVQPFTAVTDTGFSIIADDNNDEAYYMNKSGEDYQAYVFAGGGSTAATARSVHFDGSGDYLTAGSSTDYTMGTGDFTIEGWVKFDSGTGNDGLFQISPSAAPNSSYSSSIGLAYTGSSWNIYGGGNTQDPPSATQTFGFSKGQWIHFAYCRYSGTSKVFINGTQINSFTDTYNYAGEYISIGNYYDTGNVLDGYISNFRVVKGTAVYTSPFRVPTEPLTSITNTVLLCCNDSSTTGSTVTPGTITANGDPTASTDSPFDDPAGFIFGESGDQSAIKTNYYVGNGDDTNGLEVELGFEPQFIWIKNISRTERWYVFDNMRRMDNSDMDNTHTSGRIRSDNSAAEVTDAEGINVFPTGFKLTGNEDSTNRDGDTYIYIAVRAREGYVSKVPDAGTNALGLAYGTGTDPTFAPGFPVDFTFLRRPGTTENWTAAARLIDGKYLHLNATDAEASDSNIIFDYNNGFHSTTGLSTYLSWSWKRHAGFDVVTYTGNGVAGRQIPHSLNKSVEMIWLRSRSHTNPWMVYHKGLDGGTNPSHKYLQLNSNSAESDASVIWNDTAPTANHFTIGSHSYVNADAYTYLAMLFASVDGISKVGYYTGNGTSDSSTQTITTGFQPRFVLIKSSSNDEHWVTFDTTRGWSSGSSDQLLELNETGAQTTALGDLGHPISTGFVIKEDESVMNLNNHKYIYYAHA